MHDRRREDKTLRELAREIKHLIQHVVELEQVVKKQHSHKSLNLHVRAVKGRKMPRITRPPMALIDVEKALLSLAPKDADGQAVTVGPFKWTVTNESTPGVLTLVPEGEVDGLTYWAVSGVPGTATVEVTYDDPATEDDIIEEMVITVKTGNVSALNLSAGTPVPE